jgi:hypothetical protein
LCFLSHSTFHSFLSRQHLNPALSLRASFIECAVPCHALPCRARLTAIVSRVKWLLLSWN